MLKIVFNDKKHTTCQANFNQYGHVVTLSGYEIPTNEAGFKAYRISDNKYLGNYSDFTTIYRVEENAVSFSDDDSIYVEPEPSQDDYFEPLYSDEEATPEEKVANVSLEERVRQCEECLLELSEIVHAEGV